MIRARFFVPDDDYRPVTWPYPHPYWCTGTGADMDTSIVVAYADDLDQVEEFWPDAVMDSWDEAAEYVFTSRFPKPDWFEEVKDD